MPQQPTQALGHFAKRAMGMNDIESLLALEQKGYVPFAMNTMSSSDVYTRRNGRDLFYIDDGFVLGMMMLQWDDGSRTDVAQIGSVLFDLTTTYTVFLKTGARLVLQSPDGNYWNCTPDASTLLVAPTVIATPTATARSADLIILDGESFGIEGASSSASLRTSSDGWFVESQGMSSGLTEHTDDLVFTYASGYTLVMHDLQGNTHRFSVSNDGSFFTTTA